MPSDRSHCLPALLGSRVRQRIRLNGIQIAAQAVPGHLQFEAGLEAKPELGLQPRNRESRSAAAAVMGQTPASISTTSGSGTRSPCASQAGDFPRGAKKSSRRVSPGWIYDNRASRSVSSLMG